MDRENVVLAAWSYAFAGSLYLVLALRLFWTMRLSRPQSASSVYLLVAVFASAVWGCADMAFLLSGQPGLLMLGRVGDLLRYAGWFGFMLVLCRPNLGEKLPAGIAALPAIAVILLLFGLVVQGFAWFDIKWLGEASGLLLMSAMSLSVFALVLLEQVYRNVTDDSRWNVKPVSLGLAGTFLFDLYLYSQAVLFNQLDADALSIRGAVHALMVPLIFLSTTRRRDWISKIRISQKAAFHSATLFAAGVYLLFISGVGYYVRYFGGEWGRALQLGLVFSAIVGLMILALSGSVRAKFRVLIGKHFFRYRYDYREEWLKFTQTLSTNNSPEEMGQQVVRGLADMLESPGGGLWMKSSGGGTVFRQTARRNLAETTDTEPVDSPLCRFLASSGWVVNLAEYRSYPQRYGAMALPGWLQQMPQAWLIVPLIVGHDMIGFVVLASARANIDVNWEVNDLLKTAGRQAASFLSQMQATEALLEVRKFDAFNRMSAFVVHDLKNIVTQLSLMLKNAKRLHANPEFQQDMLMTVENSLDRMRQLMLQLREGATPTGTAVGVDLAAIVQRIAAVATSRGRHLEVKLGERVVTRGHEERLERIVGHVVQNAFDATELSGLVQLTLDRASGQARIVVEDTGQGMSEEFVRERLFKPFQTTKQAGMGIGAYESFLYVQELGGKILVQSELNKGTQVTILLPLFDLQPHSDLQLLDVP
ncbi:histidine kinase [Rhodoferax koreense]|uniref:histidine kinase n=1 Tax=Rhodoferax koreensis TaxID=1842727 RepID=A0A1P8K0C9_9BURK|nr:XrtA/PEP-CTERM system histidine kinase PrsK [Rhodoferax koreense]APW39457.1 histidine kinase [Rhodoferax koreense]